MSVRFMVNLLSHKLNAVGIITVFIITVGLLIWKIHRREKTDSSPDATI